VRGFKTEITDMSDNSFSLSRLSRIKEVGDDVQMVRPASLRIYGMSPEATVIQIRVVGPTTANGVGKDRKMVASAVLCASDLVALRGYIDQELTRLGVGEREPA
jgi:hypothetical protein